MSGCPTTSAQAYENCGAPAQGLAVFGVDTHDAAIKAAVLQSKPSGAPSSYLNVAEAMLRAGGLIYYKVNPGDCGAPPSLSNGFTSGQITGLSGTAASGVIGGLGVAGIIGGAATLGISSAISVAVAGIEDIFAHHAQAVANEQGTICSVANYFNAAKKQIDAAARAGQISPDAAKAYLLQVANQAKNGLASILKVCNAACVYQGICQAFMNYAGTWYDSISPKSGVVFANAPGGAPTYASTNPGGVTATPSTPPPPDPVRSVTDYGNLYNVNQPAIPGSSAPLTSNQLLPGNIGASDYLNLGYNQQTGQSAQRADVPLTGGLPWWVLVAGVVAIILVVSR